MYIPAGVREFIRRALEEDIGSGDVTTSLLVPERQQSKALMIAKGSFIVAGLPFAKEVFQLFDPETEFSVSVKEGARVKRGDIIAAVSGRTGTLLTCERVSLNLLQRLCGIATVTSDFVREIKGLDVRIVDTRKTTPGMRFMEKYAVRAGGGLNHRFGLFDGILIKDNHIEAAGGIGNAVSAARKAHHLMKIEVEVESLKDLEEALRAGADIVMLDNMSTAEMKKAAGIVQGRALIEASGNMTLERVREVAECGVNLISVGALTHSAPAADISMKLVK
ncbi:MAG TPA: carboxylating nicotinate-nucleotide diphosphorylase [Thermodesulfovibrionales bacterium]|nr:carboxylating nicotinate-nucleotide diphosphorylase [Thermodesulfovibrionales bacterium]